jgi:diguanylate cyclase (GGDEF)-like protein
LKGLTQEADVIARIAGDEFIVCLTNIRNKETLKNSLEAMLTRLSEPQVLEGLTLHSTFCMGLSLYPNDGAKLGILEERAELALRQAEQQHKNIAIFFDEIQQNKS